MTPIPHSVKKSLFGKHSVLYACPACKTELDSPLEDAGRDDQCPQCRHAYAIPGIEALATLRAKEKEEADRQTSLEKAARIREEQARLEREERDAADRVQTAAFARTVAIAQAEKDEEQRQWRAKQMSYKYKMVQIPPALLVQERFYTGHEAAAYLEKVVNEWAAKGWEFYRVDTIGVHVQAGCLGGLFGQSSTFKNFYVITFRALS